MTSIKEKLSGKKYILKKPPVLGAMGALALIPVIILIIKKLWIRKGAD